MTRLERSSTLGTHLTADREGIDEDRTGSPGRIGARHAAALCAVPEVDALVIADADAARARDLAARLPSVAAAVDTVGELFTAYSTA